MLLRYGPGGKKQNLVVNCVGGVLGDSSVIADTDTLGEIIEL